MTIDITDKIIQKSITKKYETILKTIEDITKVSFLKHPIKKYKKYKDILKMYYAQSS